MAIFLLEQAKIDDRSRDALAIVRTTVLLARIFRRATSYPTIPQKFASASRMISILNCNF